MMETGQAGGARSSAVCAAHLIPYQVRNAILTQKTKKHPKKSSENTKTRTDPTCPAAVSISGVGTAMT
jgi:hypothetical protein